jgi:hypothetical protein
MRPAGVGAVAGVRLEWEIREELIHRLFTRPLLAVVPDRP